MSRFFKKCWPVTVCLIAGVLLVSSCSVAPRSVFYDAGAGDYTATGAEFVQNWLFRFDTVATGRVFTTPNAIDIVAVLTSPAVGQVIVFGVSADGEHDVSLIGGTNVTIKPSASVIPANTTLTLYMKLDNVDSDNSAITIY